MRELHKEMLKGRREPKSIEDAEDAVRVVERNFKAKVMRREGRYVELVVVGRIVDMREIVRTCL